MQEIVDRITRMFRDELALDEKQTAVVKYSLTIYLTTILGYLAIILTAWIAGVIKFALVAAVTASLVRIFTGGAHASSPGKCILFGAVVFPLIGIATKMFPVKDVYIIAVVALSTWITTILAIYRFAPAEVPGKPVSTVQQRHRLRLMAFAICVLWLVFSAFVIAGQLGITHGSLLASALGLGWQAFSLTPLGYKTVVKIDSIF
ncbi:accessory gene regulator ArgB-like protein [Thermincola potens]|uniref:Accessory gene regulator B n=1 Tax=Thermincola potens (strain JR) TaxID=635013 RepID=D5XC39_THEPJ|nr:accessory gene regulator B family protein [Thermincola potens]ADG83491.1 Accessory gene regulator B [Thermincola potens JR]